MLYMHSETGEIVEADTLERGILLALLPSLMGLVWGPVPYGTVPGIDKWLSWDSRHWTSKTEAVGPRDEAPELVYDELGNSWRVYAQVTYDFDEDPSVYPDGDDIVSDIIQGVCWFFQGRISHYDRDAIIDCAESCQEVRCWKGRESGKLYARVRLKLTHELVDRAENL
jgi:hypothetical protein